MSKYYKQGFSAAVESKCALSSLFNYLDGAYDEISNSATISSSQKELYQRKLVQEIEQSELQKNRIDSTIRNFNQLIDSREQEIETNELERFSTRNYSSDKTASDKFLPYALGVIITLGLTFFLILFYSSTGFTILFDVPASGNGILNPSVYSVAYHHGGNALLFVLFFPFIFIAVGFATYITFDKYQKTKKGEASQARNWLILIIGFTFIIDAIIGYKITQGVYLRDYESGIHSQLWSGEMIFFDVHFYLILFLGFIAYLLWGLLLSYVLNHPYGDTATSELHDNNRTITLNEELLKLTKQLNEIEVKSNSLSTEIQQKKRALSLIERGEVPTEYMVRILEHSIQEFILGYNTYAEHGMNHLADSENRMFQILNIQEKWLKSKIEVLNL
ncbi:MAG: hypothetical protein ACI8ZM_001800 [Crocinitomix sp.]|jgi:hypothetical protein